jgi:hypothetical protein
LEEGEPPIPKAKALLLLIIGKLGHIRFQQPHLQLIEDPRCLVAVVSIFTRHAMNIRDFQKCSIAKAAVSEN